MVLLTLGAACSGTPEWRGLAKVGLIASFHGPEPRSALAVHSTLGELLVQANRDGGVKGTRLELVSLDDLGDEAVSRHRVEELIRDPGVVAVVVFPGAATASGLEASGVPVLEATELSARDQGGRLLDALRRAAEHDRIERRSVKLALAR